MFERDESSFNPGSVFRSPDGLLMVVSPGRRAGDPGMQRCVIMGAGGGSMILSSRSSIIINILSSILVSWMGCPGKASGGSRSGQKLEILSRSTTKSREWFPATEPIRFYGICKIPKTTNPGSDGREISEG